MIRQKLAQAAFRVTGWKMVGEVPRSGVFVGAPHTSNWDFIAMLAVTWHDGVQPRVLVKQEMFRGPLGWVMRKCGGIPVDRHNAAGTVKQIVSDAAGEPFLLILAAEGTRSKGEYWKSGFYRIAEQAELPIVMAFIDGPTKTTGIGPSLIPTGDVGADMDVIRAFYADKQGLRPANRTEPRLREEAPGASGAS